MDEIKKKKIQYGEKVKKSKINETRRRQRGECVKRDD